MLEGLFCSSEICIGKFPSLFSPLHNFLLLSFPISIHLCICVVSPLTLLSNIWASATLTTNILAPIWSPVFSTICTLILVLRTESQFCTISISLWYSDANVKLLTKFFPYLTEAQNVYMITTKKNHCIAESAE